MDIRTLFSNQTSSIQATTKPDAMAAAEKFESFSATLANAEGEAKAALSGNADPHALVTALAQSELAVETAVTLRNKVVEAYQEILRMPV
ncbi:MAG: flagellar hook-basal body complex protein FliE [Thalassococcus sp.]|uniref:flagellar hook-basal body complex protein FliE n=1 Tax=Thalassococcus sp. TaxID=1928858 RepID=UPI001B0A6CDE|nr:flagellar hook-basal body complex protein FliE [Thalassococcus sp.]MBO6866411.1 flagellar hook-basal body complex protein FliE [Thalassococcus sp.]